MVFIYTSRDRCAFYLDWMKRISLLCTGNTRISWNLVWLQTNLGFFGFTLQNLQHLMLQYTQLVILTIILTLLYGENPELIKLTNYPSLKKTLLYLVKIWKRRMRSRKIIINFHLEESRRWKSIRRWDKTEKTEFVIRDIRIFLFQVFQYIEFIQLSPEE